MSNGELIRWSVLGVGLGGLVFFGLGLWLGRKWERGAKPRGRSDRGPDRGRDRKNGNGRGAAPNRQGGPISAPKRENSSELYVGNLSLDVTKDEILQTFGQYGKVVNIRLIAKRGEPKGFGFIEMSKPEEAEQAIKALHGRELKGSPIEVNIARAPKGRRNHRR